MFVRFTLMACLVATAFADCSVPGKTNMQDFCEQHLLMPGSKFDYNAKHDDAFRASYNIIVVISQGLLNFTLRAAWHHTYTGGERPGVY